MPDDHAATTGPEPLSPPPAGGPARDVRVALAAVLIFAVVSLVLNVTSTGFLEADGVTHYLYARWALAEPHLLTNVWGRPVVTTLHALPAQLPGTIFGQPLALVGVRCVSLLLAVGCALMCWRVATHQGPDHGHARPALAAIFLLAMPLVVLHSISELTELPFAFLAIVALWAYQGRTWWLLALTAGLLPAARPEGFGFALMAAGGLLLHRRWEAVLVALPLIVWDRLGWWQYGGRPGEWWQVTAWLRDNWPYSGESTYPSGPLLKFVGMLPAVVGPAVLPFVLAGVWATCGTASPGAEASPRAEAQEKPWREAEPGGHPVIGAGGEGGADGDPATASPRSRTRSGEAVPRWRDHGTRVGWLVAFLPLFVLGVHSVLHWLGKMASSGDVRYLVCVAPFWALLAARGWDWLSARLNWRRDYLFAALAAAVPPILMQIAYPIVPLAPDQPAKDAAAVARWYDDAGLRGRYPNLLTDHPMVWFYLDLNPQRSGGGQARVEAAEPGSLFLWHDVYSTHNADARFVVRAEMPPRFGWRDATPQDFPPGWRAFATEPE